MNAFFAANRLSDSEKQDILSQHRTIYDGYRTLQPNVNNQQPLYVQDFAKDKVGAVINNKGIVKPYTNVGIHEQVESKHMCEQCGGMMNEKECMECGWKGEVGAMEEGEGTMCSECGSEMYEGECRECGSKMESLEEIGHLSDIYNVEDLGDDEFDYVEGGGNKYGTFEKMHHMKGIKNEQAQDNFVDNFEDPDNEDDADVGSDDLEIDSSEMYEQGYTGGGNAPDMDISNIDPAYDFKSDGPSMGDEPFDVEADDMDLDKNEEGKAFDFQSNGPDSVYPTESMLDEDDDFEFMESAFDDNELEEANDISGVQGIYGDMEPAFDFDSKGPGSAGPYQTSSWGEGETKEQYLPKHIWNKAKRQKDAEEKGEDFDDSELDITDYDDDIKDKSWQEITAITGDDEFSHVDEDIRESFIQQKNKITEMFNRMKVIK